MGASVALMVYDHQAGHLQRMHAALSTFVYPVQWFVNAPYAVSDWARTKLATHQTLIEENTALKQQLQDAQVQLQQLASVDQENARLRDLMQASTRVSGRISAAELLAADLDPFRHQVVVNKGSQDGVYEGQTVLDSGGIVGQITRVELLTSEVTLISDPSQAIQVEINRTGLRTLAVGTADVDQLSLPYLTNNADVKPGDLLVSSGLGGHYPPGYPVGMITKFERSPAEPFAAVVARTAADLSHGRQVLLYWAPQPLAVSHSAKPETAAAPKTAGKKKP
jgi:rod shape-determining protein MreC